MTKRTKESFHQNIGTCLTSRLALLTAMAAVPLMLTATPGFSDASSALQEVSTTRETAPQTGLTTRNAGGVPLETISLNFAKVGIEYKEVLLLACANGSHIPSCGSLKAAVDDYTHKGGKEPATAVDYFLKIDSKEANAATDYYLKIVLSDVLVSSFAVDYFLKIDGVNYKEGQNFPGLIAGSDGKGHTIYRGKDGGFFYLDKTTGDKKFLSDDFIPFKFKSLTKVVGVDKNGNVLRQGEKGDVFFLDLNTGDKVSVKDFAGLPDLDANANALIAAENDLLQLEANINQLATYGQPVTFTATVTTSSPSTLPTANTYTGNTTVNSGNFKVTDNESPRPQARVAVGDINGDGHPDERDGKPQAVLGNEKTFMDGLSSVRTQNPYAVGGDAGKVSVQDLSFTVANFTGAKSALDLARKEFADNNFGNVLTLATSSQEQTKAATREIDVLSWSWGISQQGSTKDDKPRSNIKRLSKAVGEPAITQERQHNPLGLKKTPPAPTGQNTGRSDHADVDIPDTTIDMPDMSGAGGGGGGGP